MMKPSRSLLLAAALLPAIGLSTTASAETVEADIGSEYESFNLVRVADGISHGWAVGFLPDGRVLVTERAGALYLIENGNKTELDGLPSIAVQGQGGLLDVVPHPDYDDSGWIYFTYSKGDSDSTVPALARARIDGDSLVDMEELFESNTPTSPGRHYGSRIVFLEDGTLLMTIGDRGAEPPRAQDPMDHSGSIVRLTTDGDVPDNNPFVDSEEHAPEIFSYGHRNIQGMIVHPDSLQVWVTEHGPRGGDELNLIEAGGNYGWPTVTLGRDYRTEDDFPDAEARRMDGMVDPVFEFLPTLAPSGLAVVNGDAFPAWEGNLLAGGLRAQRILRLTIEDNQVVHAEELLHGKVGRIRDVRQAPDGHIYVLSDESDGALYRMEPAD